MVLCAKHRKNARCRRDILTVAGAAGVGAAATATAATAATTAGATATAVAAKAGVSALAAKVIAIVVGAALAVSAAVGGIYIATNNSDTEITEEDDNDGGENYGDNGDENNGENNGENSGENGENTPPAHTHTYENGFCTVCGAKEPSKGLEFTLNADGESYSVSGRGSCRDAHIVIPATHEGKPVTDIAMEAFWGTRRIEGITLPNSIKTIGEWAFVDCASLTNINIPDSVTSIGYEAFYACTSLTSITIPDSVTSIGSSAFGDCTKLTSINYGGTMAEWEALEKAEGWDENTPAYTVHCTDGDVAKW